MMTPFNAPVPEVFRSPVSHYRMRAEFRIWHDGDDLYHIIFDQQTKSRIRVDSFPAASELINQLMTADDRRCTQQSGAAQQAVPD